MAQSTNGNPLLDLLKDMNASSLDAGVMRCEEGGHTFGPNPNQGGTR